MLDLRHVRDRRSRAALRRRAGGRRRTGRGRGARRSRAAHPPARRAPSGGASRCRSLSRGCGRPSGSSIRWRPFRFARIHSLRAMTHARDRNPLGSSEVNSVIRCSANGDELREVLAHAGAFGTRGPRRRGRRRADRSASAASQSASRAACDPMDQSTCVASIPTGYALGEARPRRPPSCERRSSPRAAPVPPRLACPSPCRGAPSTFGRRPPDRGRPRDALQARGPARRLRRRASPRLGRGVRLGGAASLAGRPVAPRWRGPRPPGPA